MAMDRSVHIGRRVGHHHGGNGRCLRYEGVQRPTGEVDSAPERSNAFSSRCADAARRLTFMTPHTAVCAAYRLSRPCASARPMTVRHRPASSLFEDHRRTHEPSRSVESLMTIEGCDRRSTVDRSRHSPRSIGSEDAHPRTPRKSRDVTPRRRHRPVGSRRGTTRRWHR